MDFQITHISLYNRQETLTYSLDYVMILLNISGLKQFVTNLANIKNNRPCIIVTPAHESIKMSYNAQRENWTILLNSQQILKSSQPEHFDFQHREKRISLPAVTYISKEFISGWRAEFMRIREAWQNPTIKNQLRCETGIANIFRYIIDSHPDSLNATPAVQLKQLIDSGCADERNLEELSEKCGYTSDHMRVLFGKEFGLSPKAYQNNRRISRAIDLISNSTMTVGQISETLGFAYSSHFSAMFRKATGLSPSQAIRKLRHNTL